MLDKIDVSLLSITFDKAENLNIPVKFSSVSVLYVAIAFETFVVSVDISLVVKLESNLNVVTRVMKVVSGSIDEIESGSSQAGTSYTTTSSY